MKRFESIEPRTLFWLELIMVAFIPFIIWWATTPTNILNSSFLFGLLANVGLSGVTLIFFAGIPLGLTGMKKAKELGKLRILTIVLSLINLFAGIVEVGMLILLLCMVGLGRVSV